MKVILKISLVVVLGVTLVGGCLMLAGCSNNIENNTSKNKNTGRSKEVQGEDLKSVPPYPNSTRVFYIKGQPDNGNISITIIYETADSCDKVGSWYKDKMAGLGWTVSASGTDENGLEAITFGKSESDAYAIINIANEGDITKITIMYNGSESGA